MSRHVFRAGLWRGLALPVLGLCFFAECTALKNSYILGPALAEVAPVLDDPGTQWMVFICAGTYFLAFLALRRRHRSIAGDFWLLVLLAMVAVAYALAYAKAAHSTQALTLVGGPALGQVAALWAEWRGQKLKTEMLRAERGEGEGGKQKVESRNGAGGTVTALVILLAGAAVWQAEAGHLFQYRGHERWSGPWDNPNTFGMLMGVGVVLALGRMVSPKAEKLKTEKLKAGGEHPTSNIQHRTSNWRVWVRRVFYIAAAGVMSWGLVKSYSRGAWVGTVAGMAYLFWKAEGRRMNDEGRRGKAVALVIICASVGVLAFWSFRETERVVARRAYTVANSNDFSWRKRVAAYEGALQMVADKPWLGFGWSQPERVYSAFYCPPKVDEGAAIQLNDYFMLGMTLGLPALVCFGMCVGLALARPLATDHGPLTTDYWLKTTCRAGAVVLLVGFWFDGGLFRLATGATFWILLELGRGGDHEIHEAHERATPEGNRLHELNELNGYMVRCVWGPRLFVGVLVALVLAGAVLWAKGRDPLQRVWFRVRVPGQGKVECVAVLPKMAAWPLPVVVYLHGAGSSVLGSGNELRQMAEMGLAVVGVEYEGKGEGRRMKDEIEGFDGQFTAVLDYLRRQGWADTNRMAWVGYSLGAQRSLAFALQHPGSQPELLVRLAGGWVPELETEVGRRKTEDRGQKSEGPSTLDPHLSRRSPTKVESSTAVLLIHGTNDEVFPLAQAEGVAACLRTNGFPVELKVLPGEGHGVGGNRLLVFRVIGEQCLTRLKGPDALGSYRSILAWQAQARPLWLFWTPAIVWAVVWVGVRRGVGQASHLPAGRASVPASPFPVLPAAGGTPTPLPLLRWLAAVLATAALGLAVLHLVPPRMAVSDFTLSIARKHLVQAKEMSDFGYLAAQPVWRGKPLRTLLEHIELAHYNRELINWKLDEQVYRDYVLSPQIAPASDGGLNCRRALWENFYPRIRREQDPAAAAEIVVRFLRERVTITQGDDLPGVVAEVWQRQVTNEKGFEALYVAALRSVGVPARLAAQGRAEFWTGAAWQPAPRPVVGRWQ